MRGLETMLRVIFLIVGLLVSSSAFAERKVALLIGNAAYTNGATALRNPPNDVALLGDTLKGAGFDVTVLQDAARVAMSRALADFEEKVTGADIGLIYYSGHGMELGGENFLIPVDAKLASDRDVKYEAIDLEYLIEALAGATKLKLVLLDACRDNPFLSKMKRSLTRSTGTKGLARVESQASNLLIGYATAPGDVALDGDGENSPYASALSRHLVNPGSEVDSSLRAVAREVYEKTGGKQRPFITGSLFETVILGMNTTLVAGKETHQIAIDPCRDAAAHWHAVSTSKSKDLLEEHVRLFSTCAFASVAKWQIDEESRKNSATNIAVDGSHDPEVKVDLRAACDKFAADPDDPEKVGNYEGVQDNEIQALAAIEACRYARRQFPEEMRIRYQLARSLERSGDLTQAIAEYEAAATGGYTAAAYRLGVAYRYGRGVQIDQAAALKSLMTAARSGHAPAMYDVGSMYSNGLGTALDYAEAMRWYQAAAKAGEPRSFGRISQLYLDGASSSLSSQEAAEYFEKAIRNGETNALDDLRYEHKQWPMGFVKALQSRLSAAGTYRGTVDGKVGPGTLKALEQLFGKG
ncbi:MAG: caspase family protein [Proteobacteria bacterium]|nr:caspase family protein [Pseudomonadota bacterium]